MGKNITDQQRVNIVKLYKSGKSAIEVMKITGHSSDTVYRAISGLRETKKRPLTSHVGFSGRTQDDRFIYDSF